MYRPTVEDMTHTKSFKQLNLRDAGQFDHTHKLRDTLTGWGKICRHWHSVGISRSLRLRAKRHAV